MCMAWRNGMQEMLFYGRMSCKVNTMEMFCLKKSGDLYKGDFLNDSMGKRRGIWKEKRSGGFWGVFLWDMVDDIHSDKKEESQEKNWKKTKKKFQTNKKKQKKKTLNILTKWIGKKSVLYGEGVYWFCGGGEWNLFFWLWDISLQNGAVDYFYSPFLLWANVLYNS